MHQEYVSILMLVKKKTCNKHRQS